MKIIRYQLEKGTIVKIQVIVTIVKDKIIEAYLVQAKVIERRRERNEERSGIR